jgi:hypothetical protein
MFNMKFYEIKIVLKYAFVHSTSAYTAVQPSPGGGVFNSF